MDPILSKLILSREKSVKALEVDIAKLDKLASETRNPQVQASLVSVSAVKRQRLTKLLAELVGFRQAAGAQVELPAVDPTVRKK
ncbi:MAG: hypothetical protein [Microviridae sp.]|nr:MAG: hypothetical protein [Microviridae sp.]